MDSKETIFRQKSIDRVSSPEQLDKYLKVSSPSLWVFLIGIIIVLIGTIVWCVYGRLNTYATVGCAVENSTAYCYVREEDSVNLEEGAIVKVTSKDVEITVDSIDLAGVNIPDSYAYLQHLVGVTSSDYVNILIGKTDLANGYYPAKVAVESLSPLKFILN